MRTHNTQHTTNHAAGFTLIELLVVVVIFSLIVVASVGLFLNTVIGQDKLSSGFSVKQNGEYALSRMNSMIRNSSAITSATATSLTIKNADDDFTTFALISDPPATRIASNSAYLTGSEVTAESLGFTYGRDASNNITTVTISFQLRKGQQGVDRARDIVTQTFRATVGLRSN